MDSPPNITFRKIDASAEVREHVRARIEELEKFHPHIISCDVVVDAPQRSKPSGREYRVQINLQMPGPDIHVSQSYGRAQPHEDMNLAINRAFEAAQRKLKAQSQTMSGHDVKEHAPLLHGEVTLVFNEEGYGFLKADDGREVYLERDSMTAPGQWDDIAIGTRLRFREEMGDKGPFATNITVIE